MGRVTTLQVKNLANELLDNHRDKFTTDFKKNKMMIEELVIIHSKKIKNKLTGYVTNSVRRSRSPKTFETHYQAMENKSRRRKRF